MLAIASLFFAASCSENPDETPDPADTQKSCRVTGIGEVSDGDAYNTSYTYDNAGNLITRTDPDGAINFTYDADNKLTGLSFGVASAAITYDGNTLPYRIDFAEDGEEFYYILKSENGRYVAFESHYIEEGESILEDVTNITYDASGNVTSVESLEYDQDTDEFTTFGTVKNITHDDQKNPYTTSVALMIYELLDGDEANLSANNVVNYTYDYGIETDVSNSYIYNEEDYPTKRDESGFSSPTTYNFSYSCE